MIGRMVRKLNVMIDDELVIFWHALWTQIAEIVQEYSRDLLIITNVSGDLRIETKDGRPFVRVRVQRKHVGVYLLPLYYHRRILPSSLKQYYSGKGTLRFIDVDENILSEFRELMERCQSLIGFF